MPTTAPVAAHRCTQATRSPRCWAARAVPITSAVSAGCGGRRDAEVPPHLRVRGGGVQLVGVRQVQRLQPDVLAVQRHRVVPGRAGRPQVRRQRRGDPGVRLGWPGGQPQRQHAGPVRQVQVGLVLADPAGAGPDGHLAQWQRQYGGLGQLAPAGRAGVGAASRADLLDQRGEHGELLPLVGDQSGGAVRDDRAVVGAVVELGAGVDQPVEQRHRDADRQPVVAPGGEQRPAAGGAVQVERVADADVQGGQHPRLAVDGEAERAVVRLVEHGVGGGLVVAHPVAGAVGCGPGGGWIHARAPLF